MMTTLMTPNLKPKSYSATTAMSFFVESAAAADDADFDYAKLEAQIKIPPPLPCHFFLEPAAAADKANFIIRNPVMPLKSIILDGSLCPMGWAIMP